LREMRRISRVTTKKGREKGNFPSKKVDILRKINGEVGLRANSKLNYLPEGKKKRHAKFKRGRLKNTHKGKGRLNGTVEDPLHKKKEKNPDGR